LSREDFILLPRENRFNINLNDKEKYYRSSKIQALLDRLLSLGPDDKVVVFSQFLGMLDLIEH
jgi:SNF2 family DNA or RNA helicase